MSGLTARLGIPAEQPLLLDRVVFALRNSPGLMVVPVGTAEVRALRPSSSSPPGAGSQGTTRSLDGLILPVSDLADPGWRHFRVPVLGVGSPAEFEAIPPGSCSDVITDEFTTSELRFRLFRMIRPVYRFPSGDKLVCHGLSISDGSRTAEITDSEQQTLELLLRAGEQEVPRAALLAILTRSGRLTKHGLPAEARTSRALDMHVSRLRAKLLTVAGAWAAPLRITAVRGGGYRLSQSEQIPYHQVVDNS